MFFYNFCLFFWNKKPSLRGRRFFALPMFKIKESICATCWKKP